MTSGEPDNRDPWTEPAESDCGDSTSKPMWVLFIVIQVLSVLDLAFQFGLIGRSRGVDVTGWRLNYAHFGAAVQDAPLSPTARQFLRYDSAESKSIFLRSGTRIQVVDLRWQGGEVSAAAARLHDPKICLPAIGYRFEGALPETVVEANGEVLSFSGSQFGADDGKSYVFRVMWENGLPVTDPGTYDQSLRSAIRAVKERRRLEQSRVLTFMVKGPQDAERAAEEFTEFLIEAVTGSAAGPSGITI